MRQRESPETREKKKQKQNPAKYREVSVQGV
jgi:hypothetical protein